MNRVFLPCALLLFLLGCSPSEAPTPMEKPGKSSAVKLPEPVTEIEAGPAEKDLAKTLDLPVYPGAKIVKNEAAKAGAEVRYHLDLITKDSLAKVADFYQAHGLSAGIKGNKAEAMGTTKNGNLVLVAAEHKGETTSISIKVSPANH